ncbi:MAG: TldD/PmbA family protein [Planctomycetota bacterium]
MQESMLPMVRAGLEAALDRAAAGGASARIRFERTRRTRVEFESGRLKRAAETADFHFTLDVVRDGHRASVSGNDIAALPELVDRALTLSAVGSVAHFDAFPPPAPVTETPRYAAVTAAVTRQDLIDACEAVVEPLKERDPDLDIRATGEVRAGEGLTLTTGGVDHTERETLWSFGAGVQRTEGTDMLFCGDGRAWRDAGAFWEPEAVLERIRWDLDHGGELADPPTGAANAFFPAETMPMLLASLQLGLNGRNVAKGDSPLRNRLGEQVLSPAFTLVDNPHRAYAPGAAEIDDAGVPARRQVLVEGGVPKCFLYDLDSAGLADTAPTGNPGCRPHNPEITPGETPSAALLGGIDDGIYIKSLIGFGQSNIVNGDISCNVGLGYRIRNGAVVGRVKNTMVAGNLYDLLGEGLRLSSDVHPVTLHPCAVVEGLHVSAAGG